MSTRDDKTASHQKTAKGRFGTFAGVFTPTVLTILGLILFLRMGYVVGNAGLIGAIVIICLANVISFITGLSLSSIATNMHVKTGGTYYMIARTLGLEIGGAIGIPLYLSQAVSVAFYVIGFSEAFGAAFPGTPEGLLSTALVLGFGLLAFVGADFALKIQYVILAVLAAALISFFAGGWGHFITPQLSRPETAAASFWQIFAVYFPAVTGIAVGVSMSGDLKDPSRSIPRGTLTAIGITFLVYLATALWLGFHAEPYDLLTDNTVIQKVALYPGLILLGVWAATLSSALGSVLAAPRTLEAISKDRAVPQLLGARMGSATEPRLAVIVTTVIAVAVVQMGNLDFVAPIITMFFLNTYGMINLTAGIERMVGNPSFRPQFRVPWPVSILGALGCYAAMFLIHPTATVAAILISYGVFVVLGRRALRQDWGDVRSGIWFSLARFGLIRLEAEAWSAKNWRPNIVVFTGLPQDREELRELGTWLSSGRGIVSFVHLIIGNVDQLINRGLRTTATKNLQEYIRRHGVTAFAECSISEDFYQGVLGVVQNHGIAGLEPNTTVMGWSTELEMQRRQVRLIRTMLGLRKSILFLCYDENKGFGNRRRIDVWWRGRDRNAELMLLLAHLIRQSRAWEGAEIRVMRLMDNEAGRQGASEHIARLLRNARVDAEPVVLVREYPGQPFSEVLKKAGVDTDLVLMGLRAPEEDEDDEYQNLVNRMVSGAGTVLLVRSGEMEDILDTEGRAA